MQKKHVKNINAPDIFALAKELNKEEHIEAIANCKVTGLSGVKHTFDILIRKPCNVAIIIPEDIKDIAAEVIKAIVMTIDTKIPIIFPVSAHKRSNVIFDLVKEYPLIVISYESVEELVFKIKSKINDICCCNNK